MQKTETPTETFSDIVLITEDMCREVMGNVITGLNPIRSSCDVHIRYEEFLQYSKNKRYTRGSFKVQGFSDFQVRIAMHLVTQCISYYQYIYEQTRSLQKLNRTVSNKLSASKTPNKFRSNSMQNPQSGSFNKSAAQISKKRRLDAQNDISAEIPPVQATESNTKVHEDRAEAFLNRLREDLKVGQ